MHAMMTARRIAVGCCAVVVPLGFLSIPARGEDAPTAVAPVYYDAVAADGQLIGGRTELVVTLPGPDVHVLRNEVTTVLDNGPPANRIDIVTVGDGYRYFQMSAYAYHVNLMLEDFFEVEPFATYAPYFNVHRVDVISNEQGVDHDPVYPVWRDTALDMGYWCEGIERLLCVDVEKAWQHALNAPDVDSILAIANSSKYGGAGYPEQEVATVAGGDSLSEQIALHELGHSLGDLADEYDYGSDDPSYSGPEPAPRNVSAMDATEMADSGAKWAAWLGESFSGYGGLHSTFEGAYYHVYDVYRPTNNSMMRALQQPFNLPSCEGLIIEIYKLVHPIDDATPPEDLTLTGAETLTLSLVQPIGHALDVQWSLDGAPLPAATEPVLDLADLPLAPGEHTVSVTVVDNTWMVRDAAARAAWLTETRSWNVAVIIAVGDLNCDGTVGLADINPFALALADPAGYAAAFPDCERMMADCNGDGTVDVADINPFVLILTGQW